MRKKKSLKGLEGIYVVVEDLGPEMRGKLTRKQIQTNIEGRLAFAGIPILKEKEAAKTMGEPYLYINLAALPIDRQRFACRMDVELHQLVALINGSRHGHAITWDAGIVTIGTIQELLESLDDLFLDFIDDFLAVNPQN
jgi:hypothetical protein